MPVPDSRVSSSGLALAVGAYGLWGLLPVYFLSLSPSGPAEIVAWRITLSLVFCLVLLVATRALRGLVAVLRDTRVMVLSLVAGILIAINWNVYVVASLSGLVVEASLGYFINPIVSIALGVVLLRERLRAGQWVAVGVSVIAVLVLTIGYGRPPVVALTLALSFGFYGFVKNRLGPRVTAVEGLTLETAWLVPLALLVLVWVHIAGGGITAGQHGVGHAALLAAAGVVTAVPLLLFAAAARRLPLSTLGLIMYVSPIFQFAFGVAILGEPMPLERWVGFALVWVALVVITIDGALHRHASERARRRTAAEAIVVQNP